ncbi:MAG: DUF3127 domain-containing protein [Marinilabiliales bacterium]|nr:MAG: DUF3127 domain-containing protein [Marinilabiliales bacterium]
MNVVLEGKVLQILPAQSGTGKNGPWVKQDFIIETPGDFARKICISAWGDRAEEAGALQAGDQVSVNVNIESREFNERWYTDVKAWKIEKAVSPDTPVPPPGEDVPPPSDEDLLPF